MNKADKAMAELRAMDELASMDSPIHRLPPLPKLLATLIYIGAVLSFNKYDLTGLFAMVLFPIVCYQLSYIPVRTCFRKLRIVMPLVCAVGILNPLYDQEVILRIGSLGISGGIVSLVTLAMKGIFALMMSFLLVATTRIEAICHALHQLHVPHILVTLLLLTYRYIGVLLEEVSVMTTAYQLRAPGQRGVHYRAWGSLLGQLILRSMDRASELYESMVLRGYDWENW